ncbi:MAG: hypothetical protein ACYDIC_17360 [Desulfobaccales bacterium]
MKTFAAFSGIMLFCWVIFFPVLGWAQSPEVPKAALTTQSKTAPAEKPPAPSPQASTGESAKPTPAPSGVTAKPAPAPSLAPAKALNATDLAAGLDRNLILVLLLTLVMGGVGGIVYELLILQGNLELPHKPDPEEITDKFPYAVPKFLFDLGIFARIIIGGAAALAALLVLTPVSTTNLLAISLVAGSAGTSVFRSMQDRLLTALAQKDAADKGTQVNKINTVNTKALEKIDNLKKTAGPSAPGAKGLTGIGIDDLDEIEKLLREAKGLGG